MSFDANKAKYIHTGGGWGHQLKIYPSGSPTKLDFDFADAQYETRPSYSHILHHVQGSSCLTYLFSCTQAERERQTNGQTESSDEFNIGHCPIKAKVT